MWLGKLTTLNMTPLGWLGRKTSTQTNKITVIIFEVYKNQITMVCSEFAKEDMMLKVH